MQRRPRWPRCQAALGLMRRRPRWSRCQAAPGLMRRRPEWSRCQAATLHVVTSQACKPVQHAMPVNLDARLTPLCLCTCTL
eukprot:358234-Chlamydomonas_euryale.AAC.8